MIVYHYLSFVFLIHAGIEEFEGRYLHSWEYRSAEGLQGKRVVVVGIGNSGGDIAVDASRVAEQVSGKSSDSSGSISLQNS